MLRADHDGAAPPVCAGLPTMRHMDDPMGVVLCLDALAWVADANNEAVRALTLLAAAEAAWAAIPAAPPAPLRRHHDAALGTAREALPEAAYRAALANGSAMSPAEAVAYALGESPRPASRSAVRTSETRPRPTRREQDVAVLVARGLSNSQIASELVISARTVETHVQHIMDKLGVSTRGRIAAWSAAWLQTPPPPGPGTPGSRHPGPESVQAGSPGDRSASR
ncbi:MAG: response regulator transcription factor [Micromonosporaceae bacterium]